MRFAPVFAVLIGSSIADFICVKNGHKMRTDMEKTVAADPNSPAWRYCPEDFGCCFSRNAARIPSNQDNEVFYICSQSQACDPVHGNECGPNEVDGTANCSCGPEESC
ncbi:unnamed protein product [Zymoseptoria tritici ST99CH_3D1]|nr:unnamed protein product [Zymoseptoria tritici ST99CH_3D1]